MKKTPKVAPYQSCVKCFKGDTTTAVGLYGNAEFVVVFLTGALGLEREEAEGTMLGMAEHLHGCALGKVPDGRQEWAMRLCLDCATAADVRVGDISDAAGTVGSIPAYRERA